MTIDEYKRCLIRHMQTAASSQDWDDLTQVFYDAMGEWSSSEAERLEKRVFGPMSCCEGCGESYPERLGCWFCGDEPARVTAAG